MSGPLGLPQGDACILSYSEVSSDAKKGESKSSKSPGRFRGKVERIWPGILLTLVTLFFLALLIGILWSPAGSSVTRLEDGEVYGGLALAFLMVGYVALALRKGNQYASRLTLIGVVGLAVLLLGWTLRSV